MILYIIHKTPFLRNLYFSKVGRHFVHKKISLLPQYLSKSGHILDIGSGNGLAAFLLREEGFDITPLDIHEGQYNDTVKPIVYNGSQIPFGNKSFHTSLLLTVLHHIDTPEIVLKEAARVSKHVIVMEDIYTNTFQKYLTFFLDRVANLFYSPCPHTNKSDAGWRTTFEALGFKLIAVQYRYVIFFIKQSIYVLESPANVD